MSYCCSQCSFTAQFESALLMHHQLHHETPARDTYPGQAQEKSCTMPRLSPPLSPSSKSKNRGLRLPARTSSATKLLGKIKARICKSRTLFAHPELREPESKIDLNVGLVLSSVDEQDLLTCKSSSPGKLCKRLQKTQKFLMFVKNLSLMSECTSKALKAQSSVSINVISPVIEETQETFACHLCSFDADRITTLDRHLLNHHKIGLENLLKLVMAKTKDGLSDERNSVIFGIRQPYYRPQNEIIQEGEFIIETVTPQIKILKHASTNTEESEDSKEFNLEKNCEMISKEIQSLLSCDKGCDNEDFISKMQTLNECMCKFVNSSNMLKKVLTKEMDSKVKERYNAGEPFFDLVLGGSESPRNWQRAHSEKMERSRNKYGDACRGNKTKQSSESFYF